MTLTKVIIFLIVFAGVYYLAHWFYPFLENMTKRWEKRRIEKMAPKLDRMFLNVPLRKLILMDILAPILCGIIGLILFKHWAFALGFAAAGFTIPIAVVKKLEAGRRKKFASQLIDGIGIISSSLKAGLNIVQAFEVVAEEMPAPINQEIGLVIRQMQMGLPLEEVLTNLKKRIKVMELDILVTAILVARETGGELTETLSRVVFTLQERNKLISRVNALCVQAKLQGIIMSIIPIVFGLFVYKIDPHFFDVFLKDSFGRTLLGYVVVSQILGLFFIRRFSRIDI